MLVQKKTKLRKKKQEVPCETGYNTTIKDG